MPLIVFLRCLAQLTMRNEVVFMGRLYTISAASGITSTVLLVSGASVAWVPVAGLAVVSVDLNI